MSIIVQGIRFEREEAYCFSRALPTGYDSALGVDEKERPLVRVWRNRLTTLERDEDGERAYTEVFYEDDLVEAGAVLRNLVRRFEPETDPAWWRENGAPPPDDAIEGLARERVLAIANLSEAAATIERALLRIGEDARECDHKWRDYGHGHVCRDCGEPLEASP